MEKDDQRFLLSKTLGTVQRTLKYSIITVEQEKKNGIVNFSIKFSFYDFSKLF